MQRSHNIFSVTRLKSDGAYIDLLCGTSRPLPFDLDGLE